VSPTTQRGDTALRDGMYTAHEDMKLNNGHEAERDPEGWRRASVAYKAGYRLVWPNEGGA
jgi:hypothetical protein